MWIEHEKDDVMPEWLKPHIRSVCPYCGTPMRNYYNEERRCTNRKCSDPHCPGLVAAKADFVRQCLGIKGIGFAKCLEIVQSNGYKYPIEILKQFENKHKVTLGMYLRLMCWEGVDSGLEFEMQRSGIYTVSQLLEKYHGKYESLIQNHRDEIEQFKDLVEFDLPEVVREPLITHTIMITGTPNGFDTKDHFINTVNQLCGGWILTLHQKTKRQSGVDYLIREPGSTTAGKLEAAIKGGIPVVTSIEYMTILEKELREIDS